MNTLIIFVNYFALIPCFLGNDKLNITLVFYYWQTSGRSQKIKYSLQAVVYRHKAMIRMKLMSAVLSKASFFPHMIKQTLLLLFL